MGGLWQRGLTAELYTVPLRVVRILSCRHELNHTVCACFPPNPASKTRHQGGPGREAGVWNRARLRAPKVRHKSPDLTNISRLELCADFLKAPTGSRNIPIDISSQI